MFETIVVGIDGRPQDEEALALALRLADPGAEIIVASVGVLNRLHTGVGSDELDPQTYARVEDIVDAFTDGRPGVEGAVAEAHSVGAGLRDVAKACQADAIVVSSSRRGLLGRIFAGDSVRDVLREAPCAVGIAPVGYEAPTGPLKRVVVGHDGSPAAESALRRAVELRSREAADIELVQVVEPFAPATGALLNGASVVAEYGIATSNLARIEERYGLGGAIVTGSAAHELARTARGADLLLVGLEERSLLERLTIGSTIHALLREQAAPLLVVPAPQPGSAATPASIQSARDAVPADA